MDTEQDSLTFSSSKPDVAALRQAYEDTITDLSSYFGKCQDSYNDRRNIWPGKSRDLRKNAPDAFPWKGSSDMEAHVIDERVNAYVSLCTEAALRANIRAYPVEVNDIGRAGQISAFLKWMVNSYIPRFKKEMELAANYFLEKGIAVTYVGWHKEDRTYLQKLSLEDLAKSDPALVTGLLDGTQDDMFLDLLKQAFPSISDKRGKKALRDLKKTGFAELPVVRREVDGPMVETLSPDGEFFFPGYVSDPQRAPYCFWRTYYTPQEVLNKVATDGWDEAWVEYVIEHLAGVEQADQTNNTGTGGNRSPYVTNTYESEYLIEVIYGYQRLIDKEDNAEGIYCTVFHRDFDTKSIEESGNSVQPYAKHELLNGYEDYPIVVTRLSEGTKCLYDTQTMPELLKGIQWQVKTERDSRADRNSMSTLPPLMHPVGNAPQDWGPGRKVPYRRGGEFHFGPAPAFDPGSNEMETTMTKLADSLVGLNSEDPLSAVKRQFIIDKFLGHVQAVIKMVYTCFQRFGPDSVAFRVMGVPEGQQFDKGNPEEDFDIMIGYDVLNTDPEMQEKKLQQLVSLVQLDRNGRIDMDKLLDVIASSIDPMLADAILQPAEQAQQQTVKHVTDDLTNIFAGIEKPARPNGAQVAMQVIQQYAQQPDIQQRISSDEVFKEKLEKYYKQYEFQIQQAQNAQIGKIGTAPASMGNVDTQSIQ